jgi:hypothetical protein
LIAENRNRTTRKISTATMTRATLMTGSYVTS